MKEAMVSTAPRRDKVSGTTTRWWMMMGALIVAAACGSDPASPRGVAERFLDAHYVSIDLQAAATLTNGLARQKIEREIALVGDQTIDATTRKPVVHYKFLTEQPSGEDAVNFAYLGQINVPDAEGFERRWLVTVRRDGEHWLVANFDEVAD